MPAALTSAEGLAQNRRRRRLGMGESADGRPYGSSADYGLRMPLRVDTDSRGGPEPILTAFIAAHGRGVARAWIAAPSRGRTGAGAAPADRPPRPARRPGARRR